MAAADPETQRDGFVRSGAGMTPAFPLRSIERARDDGAAVPAAVTRAPRGSLRGEIAGGAASAAVGIALTLSTGLIALGPLGPEFAAVGVCAAFASAIAGNLVATFFGGSALGGSGPRASGALIIASLVGTLAADPEISPFDHGPAAMLAMTAATVALAGILQIAFGLCRLGRIVKFVPYPVVAGFMGGIAILIVVAQIPLLAGIARRGPLHWAQFASWQSLTLCVGLATAGAIVAFGARIRPLPPVAGGLLAGTLVYYLVHWAAPGAVLGPTLGPLDALLPLRSVLDAAGSLWSKGCLQSTRARSSSAPLSSPSPVGSTRCWPRWRSTPRPRRGTIPTVS